MMSEGLKEKDSVNGVRSVDRERQRQWCKKC